MKKLGYFLLKIILHLSALDSIGQVESINTDRPDQSDGVYIIPKNKLQFENGITQSKNSVINTLELRYGLTHSIEVGMVLNAGKVNESKGLQPLILSAKKRLIQQHNVIP